MSFWETLEQKTRVPWLPGYEVGVGEESPLIGINLAGMEEASRIDFLPGANVGVGEANPLIGINTAGMGTVYTDPLIEGSNQVVEALDRAEKPFYAVSAVLIAAFAAVALTQVASTVKMVKEVR